MARYIPGFHGNSALQPIGPEATVFSVRGSLTLGSPVALSAGPAAEPER
jgi:hypothetical protein